MDTHRRVVNFKMDSSVLLLHFDGSNDTQIYEVPGPFWVNDNFFVDSSRYAHPIWRISRFEPPSVMNPSSVINGKFDNMMEAKSGWVQWAHHEAFNFSNNDFTIDYWFKITTSPVYDSSFSVTLEYPADAIPFGNYITIGTTVNPTYPPYTEMRLRVNFKDATETSITMLSNTDLDTLPINQWHHVAFVKSGSSHKLYLDGQLESSWYGSTAFYSYEPIPPLSIYSKHHYLYVNALGSDFERVRIDEVHIAQKALWTDNFTPPVYAYGG